MLKSWQSSLHPAQNIRSRRSRWQHQRQPAQPATVEAVERRTMFSLAVGAQAFSPGVPQLVFTDIATGNTSGSGATAAQTVTITNTGGSAVSVNSASIVDDTSVSGDDSGQFQLSAPGPASIAPGASATFSVKFQAASIGLHAAVLQLQTTDATQPTVNVDLRGIGTASNSAGDVGGTNEPSLQRILNAFQIPVNVGDADGEATSSFPTPRPAGTANDEVSMPRLVKAGSGPVTIQALAAYQFNNKVGPVTHFGYYAPGTPDAKTELFQVAVGDHTSTSVANSGSFDPGSSAFSLYDTFNGAIFEDANKIARTAYSENLFNTWATVEKQKFRFFPLKNADGSVVPNAYVFTTEDFDGNGASNFDNNDLVGIIRNVAPAAAGPEIGSANLDRGTPGPKRLAFSRVQEQPPTTVDSTTGAEIPLPDNVVHDKATVRIYNSGTQPLTISSVALSNTTDFKIVTTGLSGKTIAAGGSLDIQVQFIATGGRLKNGTLTVNTNDADEGAYVIQLTGYWQQKSEHDREPTLQEVSDLAGFTTTIEGQGQTLVQGGKVAAVGDEVLSPYWRAADPAESVEVVQLGAWHTHDQEESFKWFYKGSTSLTTLFTHDALSAQSVLPYIKGSSTAIAAGTFKTSTQSGDSDPSFGFQVAKESSDDTKNTQEKSGGGFGHHVRFYPAKDASGKVIPNTYIMGMDYLAINYDYEDNVYLIRNIKPADASTTTPPAAPAGLTATPSDAGIALDWTSNAESDLSGYNVYRGTSADFTPAASNKLNGAVLTSSDYDDMAAPQGAASFYKVTAVNITGGESSAAIISATRPAAVPTAPATPTGFTPNGVTSASVNLVWTGVTDAIKYVLERRTQGQTDFTVVSSSITGTSYTDSGLSPSTAFDYRLSAVGSTGLTSAPTAVTSAMTAGVVTGPTGPTISVGDASLDEPATGSANMTFTVSLSGAADAAIALNYSTSSATAVEGTDFQSTSGTLTFAPGETSKTVMVPINADDFTEDAETFTLDVSLASGAATVADGSGVGTINANGGVSSPTPSPTGTPIPFGGKTVATYTGTDGKAVKVSLKGPGNGTVTILDNGAAQVDVTGSTSVSALTVSGGTTTLGNVSVNGSLKSFAGKAADLGGDFNVSGTLGKFSAHNTTGHHTLGIGASGGAVSIALASVSDLSIASASAIKSLKAAEWLDADNVADSIAAPSLSSLSLKGNLAADVTVGTLGKVSIGGAITGAIVRSGGDISSLRAGAIHDSIILAGVRFDLAALPTAASDFADAAAIIKSLSVTGKTAGSFSNTIIGAAEIGKVSLGTVATTNGGTPFGVAADSIASITSTFGSGKFSEKKLDGPTDSQTQDDFVLRLI